MAAKKSKWVLGGKKNLSKNEDQFVSTALWVDQESAIFVVEMAAKLILNGRQKNSKWFWGVKKKLYFIKKIHKKKSETKKINQTKQNKNYQLKSNIKKNRVDH